MNVAVSPGMQLVGPGVLPSGYGPMALSTSNTPPFVVPRQEQDRFQRRLQMLRDLDAGSRNQDSGRGRLFEQIKANYRGAYPLLTHPRVAEVFKSTPKKVSATVPRPSAMPACWRGTLFRKVQALDSFSFTMGDGICTGAPTTKSAKAISILSAKNWTRPFPIS